MRRTTASLLLAALLGAPVAHANLLANGSFEAPALDLTLTDGRNPALYRYDRIDPALLSGWDVTGASVALLDSVPGGWVAGDGEQYINLESGFASEISQTVATEPGQRYLLSFRYAPDPFASANDDALFVRWDGALIDIIDGTDVTDEDITWHLVSYFVIASGNVGVVHFIDQPGVTFAGAYLDDVQLVPAPVPLPGAALLFASGLAGMAWCRRRGAQRWVGTRPDGQRKSD